jgi:hypothetical protein
VLEAPMAPMAEFARQNLEQWSKIQASMLAAFAPPRPGPAPTDSPPSPDGAPDPKAK